MPIEEWDEVSFLEFVDHHFDDELKVLYAIEIDSKIYVGQTNNTQKRFTAHRNEKSACSYIRNALQKYGVENATIRILERDLNPDDANVMEAFYIEILDTLAPKGYNLTIGGDCQTWSPAMLEVFRSPEMRQHRRELSTAMWKDPEHRKKMSVIHDNEEWKERHIATRKRLWKDEDYRDKQMTTRATEEFRRGQSEDTKRQWEDPMMRRDKTEGIIKSRYDSVYKGRDNIRRGKRMREFIDLYNKHNGVRKHIIAENQMSLTHYKRTRKFMEAMYFL